MELKKGYKKSEVGVIPEDWEVKPFESVTNTITCGVAATPKYVSESFGKPFLSAQNVQKGKVKIHKYKHITNELFSQITRYNKPERGDLLYTRVGAGIGEAAVIDFDLDFAIYVSLTLIKPKKNLNSYFLKFLLNSDKYKSFAQRDQFAGGGVQNLNVEVVRNLPIPLPPLPEQKAIAQVLNDTDNLLQALQQKIAKKRAIKQGAMQELLKPKEGWEVKKLGEIVKKFINGGTPNTSKNEYWIGDIPWISGADILNQKIGFIRRYITKEAVIISSTNVISKGDLLLVTRTGVGKMAIAPFDVAISQDFTGIKVNDNIITTNFLFRYLDFISKKMKNQNQGTSIKGITREALTQIELNIPNINQQKVIAQALSDMDTEIEQLEEKLQKYEALKQGLMQNLLTGKIRLI